MGRDGRSVDLGGVDLFRRTVMLFQSKNAEGRTTPLNHPALELLKHKYGSRSVETELVFPSEALTRLNASNISRSPAIALKKAKMTARMVQARVDLYKVQRLLGRASGGLCKWLKYLCPDTNGTYDKGFRHEKTRSDEGRSAETRWPEIFTA